jgi:hypothetical protein
MMILADSGFFKDNLINELVNLKLKIYEYKR